MKLKNILIAAVLFGVSCSGFLEEDPKTSYTRKQIYSTDEGAWGALGAVYSGILIYNNYGYRRHIALNVASGVYTTAATGNSSLQSITTLIFSPTNIDITAIYENTFTAINTVNDVIQGVSESTMLSDSVRMKTIGDAHFMRAFLYFDAVRLWGKVPMPLHPGEGPLPRAGIIDIYTQILADLEVARQNLSPYKGTGHPLIQGHPCLYTVHALRAKVYVAMACIAEHPGEPFDASGFGQASEYWAAAYEDAKYVYDHGDYTLNPDVNDVFDVNNRYSSESLLEFTVNAVKGNNAFWSCYLPSVRSLYYGRSLQDPEDKTTRMSIVTNSNQVVAMRETFDAQFNRYPGDPRLDAYYIWQGWWSNNAASELINIYPHESVARKNQTQCYPNCKKYIDPNTETVQSNVNLKMLRYADVLLTLAEAANETDKPVSEVMGYVNEVLRRARNSRPGATAPADWTETDEWLQSREQFRQAIMDERIFELHGELHDFFEVRRRGLEYFRQNVILKHNSRIRDNADTWNPDTGAPFNIRDMIWGEDHDFVLRAMLLPIPQREINNNPMIKDNNFGYSSQTE